MSEGIKRLYPNVELHRTGKGFCGIKGDKYSFEEHRDSAQHAIKLAREKMLSGEFDILILDEIHNAVELKLVDLPQVIELTDIKPLLLHLILTGRDAHSAYFLCQSLVKAIALALSEPVSRIFHFLPAHASKIEQRVRRHMGILEHQVLDVVLDDPAVINGQIFRRLHSSVSQG